MQPILLIEDNKDDVLFIRRAFAKAGIIHPLHTANNGEVGIEYLKKIMVGEGSEEVLYPALILLDLQLPKLSGLEVLRWIREQPLLRTLIVIIHTSSHLDVDIERAYSLGANSFLVKAASGNELARMMELIKAYWLELNATIQHPDLSTQD